MKAEYRPERRQQYLRPERKYLILALLFGLLTVIFIYIYLSSLDRPIPVDIARQEVVTARFTIPPYTRITEEMVEVVSIPAAAVHPDAVKNVNAVIGTITRAELIEGEQVLFGRVATDLERATFSFRIPDGMRAISIPVNPVSGVAGFISPGDRVDILASYEDAGQGDEPVTSTILQNVQVLATGELYREADDSEPQLVETLTLAVSPAQAQAVAYYNLEGLFHVTLRFPADSVISPLAPYGTQVDALAPEGTGGTGN